MVNPARVERSHRQAIEINGYAHQNPIPMGARVGPLIMSGSIAGFDAGTDAVPADLGAQVRNIFAHMAELLANAGSGWPDVVKINFAANRAEAKEFINDSWLAAFPDPDDRPARHTRVAPDDSPPRVTADVVAYLAD
ncbi:RidA family protein [Candidatus Poriferisodalis sp.]|uniref:RidA family protein n=1 Tax=Candidatus Poriferisodalis sp. TaxID=3101277 RepID=UPI003B5C3405